MCAHLRIYFYWYRTWMYSRARLQWLRKKSKMATCSLKEVVSMYQTLIKEWNKKPVDLEKCGKLMSGMKVWQKSLKLCLSFQEFTSFHEGIVRQKHWKTFLRLSKLELGILLVVLVSAGLILSQKFNNLVNKCNV